MIEIGLVGLDRTRSPTRKVIGPDCALGGILTVRDRSLARAGATGASSDLPGTPWKTTCVTPASLEPEMRRVE
jgi:hypothetical protein